MLRLKLNQSTVPDLMACPSAELAERDEESLQLQLVFLVRGVSFSLGLQTQFELSIICTESGMQNQPSWKPIDFMELV